MRLLLRLAFLFFIGALSGWCLEVMFRKFFSSDNPEHRWINPGFCTGPYLPIYGFGLCALYLISSVESYIPIASEGLRMTVLFLIMAASTTAMEYVAGVFCLKFAKLRLWDYSDRWGNVQGIICPLFTLFWTILGILYYYFIHPHILNSLEWLTNNLAFSFVIGFFFGVLVLDAAHSAQLAVKLRAWAKEHDVVVRYETLKVQIRRRSEQERKKYQFIHPFRSEHPMAEHLKEMQEELQQRLKKSWRKGSGRIQK